MHTLRHHHMCTTQTAQSLTMTTPPNSLGNYGCSMIGVQPLGVVYQCSNFYANGLPGFLPFNDPRWSSGGV